MSKWAKRLSYTLIILFFTVLACVILTVYFASEGETGVHTCLFYTHFFYSPILLAGVLYHKKAESKGAGVSGSKEASSRRANGEDEHLDGGAAGALIFSRSTCSFI